MDTDRLAEVALGNRVVRSFGFIDLCGFTDFVEHHGDEAAVGELLRLRATVREVAPLFGVRVDKWLGDGAMLVGIENEPVVAAVVGIQQRHLRDGLLQVRAGVAGGHVLLLEGDDYTGRAVNLAARLCDQAALGQVLACPEGLELPSWVRVEEELVLAVRGMTEPVPVVALAPAPDALEPARFPPRIAALVESFARPVRSLRTGRVQSDGR